MKETGHENLDKKSSLVIFFLQYISTYISNPPQRLGHFSHTLHYLPP